MKFWVHTYGCQMNVRDTEAVEALLCAAGHEKASCEKEAEVLIVNSCTVRQKAEEKAVGKAGYLCSTGRIVGLMGCAVKRWCPFVASGCNQKPGDVLPDSDSRRERNPAQKTGKGERKRQKTGSGRQKKPIVKKEEKTENNA